MLFRSFSFRDQAGAADVWFDVTSAQRQIELKNVGFRYLYLNGAAAVNIDVLATIRCLPTLT